MSTQLILYPQTYKGRFNSTATPFFNEYIVNGINFTGLNSTTSYDTTDIFPILDSINNSPPAILGNWYRYTTTGAPWGIVPVPTVVGNNVIFLYNATAGHTGIYQQLSGLAVGGAYDVVINISTPVVGIFTIETYSGTILQQTQTFSANVSQITTTFTAQSTNTTFVLDYSSTTNSAEVVDISIQESPETASNIYTDLNDGQVICDLYQEEDIPLTLSIDDFKNVVEQVKSYSKDFNLPATKRNNRIFNNMFEVTRTAQNTLEFNPYIRTQCVLKQDGFILFEGYLRMINIKDDKGEISYNVNLYSDVIAFADTLKDATFAELDFYELEHFYDITNIKRSWESLGAGQGLQLSGTLPTTSFAYDAVTGTGHTQVLKYPFINWTNQLTTTADLEKLEVAFRPCIQLKYLINKIFGNTQFSFTSSFFDSAEFEKLFMDFNWGEGSDGAQPITGGSLRMGKDSTVYFINELSYTAASKVRFDTVISGSTGNWDATNYTYTAPVNNFTLYCEYDVDLDSVATTYTYSNNIRISKFNAAGQVLQVFAQDTSSIAAGGSKFFVGNFSTVMQAGEYIQMQSSVATPNKIQMDTIYLDSQIYFSGDNNSAQAWTLLNLERGNLNQWDFLKGIMTMFNLISMVDETNPNNILIEPYSDVFINNTNSGNTGNLTLAARSIQHDWTEKVDVSEMELKPLTDLNKTTIFKFVEDDDDYVFNLYKESTSGHLYGSKKIAASTATNGMATIFQGEKEIVAEPFAATVSKALTPDSDFSDFVTPVIYALAEDGQCSAFENSPRIFYNNGIVYPVNADFSVPAQNFDAAETLDHFLQFSHLSNIPADSTDSDFVFESQQLFPGVATNIPVNNLFGVYWQPYFNELYNSDTRIMVLKVNLSPTDVTNFKFYDVVFIKNRIFRVNKIEYKPNDLATVEFILLP